MLAGIIRFMCHTVLHLMFVYVYNSNVGGFITTAVAAIAACSLKILFSLELTCVCFVQSR